MDIFESAKRFSTTPFTRDHWLEHSSRSMQRDCILNKLQPNYRAVLCAWSKKTDDSLPQNKAKTNVWLSNEAGHRKTCHFCLAPTKTLAKKKATKKKKENHPVPAVTFRLAKLNSGHDARHAQGPFSACPGSSPLF